jgi:hypothetical protein
MVAGGEETDSTRTDSLARCQVNSRHARRPPGSARQPGGFAGARTQGRRQPAGDGRTPCRSTIDTAAARLAFTAQQGNPRRQSLSASRPACSCGTGIRFGSGADSARSGQVVAQRFFLRFGRCKNPGQGGQIRPAIGDPVEGDLCRGSAGQAEPKPTARGGRCAGAGGS